MLTVTGYAQFLEDCRQLVSNPVGANQRAWDGPKSGRRWFAGDTFTIRNLCGKASITALLTAVLSGSTYLITR
jgi:hypothetical protein